MRAAGRASRVAPVFATARSFWGGSSVVDVFDEVEEELRSDRYKSLARVWLPVGIGVALIALIAALGWWGWDSWQTRRAGEASVAYDRGLTLVQEGDAAGAESAFAEAQEKGTGAYRWAALNQRAGLAVTANRIDQAVALFDEAARQTRDPILSDMATLKAAYLTLDAAPLDELRGRLDPLMREGRPFAAYAREALAMAQIRDGQTTEARTALVLVANGLDSPEGLRERAQAAIRSIDDGTASAVAAIARAQAELPAPTAVPAGGAEGAGAPPTATAPEKAE